MLLHDKIAEGMALATQGLDRLVQEPGTKEPVHSTWEDWSLRDVFVHLSAWVMFAAGKVTAIHARRAFEEVEDIEAFNRRAYEGAAGLTLPQARKNWARELAGLGSAAAAFSEAELDSDSWPTGFRMSLARYVVMDAFVHPLQHILYHALKTGRDETFLLTMEEAKPLLSWYDPSMDILTSFGDFFEGEGARWRFFGAVDTRAFPPPLRVHIQELGTGATPPN